METESMITTFLSNLARRLRNENDLSDVTWAMCQTSTTFQQVFLNFFFPNVQLGDISLQREKSEDNSRPDFYFEDEGIIYLIECKIYDTNHHFEQYTSQFNIPAEHLGYITNYSMHQKGFVVHTWNELYNYLSAYLDHVSEIERPLWDGYLQYLQSVCSIFTLNLPMKLEGMYSLYSFYKSLDEVFANEAEHYVSELYDSKQDTNSGGNFLATPRDGVMGKYFNVKFNNKPKTKQAVWGWMGVYFARENPLICLSFDKRNGWGKPIYDLLLNKLDSINNGKYFDKPYEEDGAIWFEFSKTDDFDNEKELKKQINILNCYFNEIMETVYGIIE